MEVKEKRTEIGELLWRVSWLYAVAFPLLLPSEEERGYFSISREDGGASRELFRENALCSLIFKGHWDWFLTHAREVQKWQFGPVNGEELAVLSLVKIVEFFSGLSGLGEGNPTVSSRKCMGNSTI